MASDRHLSELLVTRQKLESRTWLLKITMGLLTATWGGIIFYIVNQID